MILGTGIDIIEIKRIAKALEKRKSFIQRFFTAGERKYFEGREKGKVESIAGYFCAKEAVVKALGTGFSGFKWQDIEIIKLPQGQPGVVLWREAKTIADQKGIGNIVLSISHCKEYAVAQAIALGKEREN